VRTANQRTGVERRFWETLIGQADVLVACSQSLATDISAWGPAQRAACVTIRNGVDIDRVRELAAPVPEAEAIPRGPFILNIATFEFKKGHDILLRAYARLTSYPHCIPLVIIGRAGPLKGETQALIDTLGLRERVTCFYDLPHARTLEYLRAATLFALPSRAEGMPIVILEAGALGIPVIATRVDGVPEIISNEHLGWLVDAEDVDGLEAGLRTLLEDVHLRNAMAQALHEHTRTSFTWTTSWEQYYNLMNGPRPASADAMSGSRSSGSR
jgi:glycosyltransferase involved in cell wall biosynthesis